MINGFIDKVLLVNLPERKDRLSICQYQLDKQGIEFELFPAIKHEKGAIGLILTMKELFKYCLENKINNPLVLEDDFEFLLPQVKEYLNQVYKELPKDFYCLHLGLNLLSQPERISQTVLRIDQAFSSHCVVYSREAMMFILPLLDLFPEVPYDITLRRQVQITGRCYATFPMICTQRDGWSDIENKETKWREIMATTYAMHTKNLQNYEGQKGEVIKCFNGHMIDGIPPTVDHAKHEPQNHNLIGKVCDCNRFSYSEEMCQCGIPEWRIVWKENIS